MTGFEDTFQYYPGGDFSSGWVEDGDAIGSYIYTWYDVSISDDSSATFSRSINLTAYDESSMWLTTDWVWVSVNNLVASQSTYWAFNVRDMSIDSYGGGIREYYIYFYDSSGYLVGTTSNLYTFLGQTGAWEIIISENVMYLRIEGDDKGSLGACSETPAYIRFYTKVSANGGVDRYNRWIIDDVTTNGDIVGIGTESTSHTLTESNLNPTNISFSINSYPFADFTSSEYTIDIKRSDGGSYTDIQNETVKPAGNTTPFCGFSNWNRSADLTDNDTVYGLYMVYLYNDGVNADTDYFFLVPPGDASSISFSSSEISIGSSETITYSIDGADFGTYNYHVRVYSQTAQIQSTAVTDASGTVTWDTSDVNAGLYFAVLSRTDKTSGAYIELNYDVATLSENVFIRGYVYDAQEETVLSNVSINFSQGSIWYNTTSNASGYYELDDITANVELNVNASLENYTHENFSFTPLIADTYTVNLYLINNTPTYSNTTIGGIVYDYPLHQAIPNATVNIYNATWSNSTTSSTVTGFYLFEELTNGTYTVNATKTNYQDSEEYEVDTNNGSWETQNILMYGIYDLTIRARDASTLGYIASFSATYAGATTYTTNGTVIYSGLTYGLYTISASATGYNANSEDILVDSTKTETIDLTQADSVYYPAHYVKFTVQNIWGTKYPGVDVSVYEGTDETSTYTGTTGSDGSVTFKLDEDTQYRITFINSTAGISETRTLYPVDDHYYIIVPSVLDSWDEYETPISDAIDFSITKNIINATHAYINVSYSDSLAETTDLTVYLNQSNASDYYNQTNLATWAAGANSSGTYSFIVTPYAGESFYVHLMAEHTTYDTIDSVYSVSFADDISTKFPGIPASVWLYAGVFILLFTGGIFVKTNVEKGMLLICVMNFIFIGLGIYKSLPNNIETNILGGTILAFIFAIIANLNKSSKEEGFN